MRDRSGDAESNLDSRLSDPGWVRRLADGWLANAVQLALALTQQLVLIPVFLHFWNPQTLAAWLALYAASAMLQAADFGLQLRAINRFLALKSCVDCNGRTNNFYCDLLQVYVGLVLLLSLLLIVGTSIFQPSLLLRFGDTTTFDAAFDVMTVGTLLALPSRLVTGLYRVHGRYARGVWLQNGANAMSQVAQVVAVVAFGSVLSVAIAYAMAWLSLANLFVDNRCPKSVPITAAALWTPIMEVVDWADEAGLTIRLICVCGSGAAQLARSHGECIGPGSFGRSTMGPHTSRHRAGTDSAHTDCDAPRPRNRA